MMKMNSIIHTYLLPLALPTFRAAWRFAGQRRALLKTSAKGASPGTTTPAAFFVEIAFL